MKKEKKKLANSVLGGGGLQNRKAFTLIELLAIIVILAIIAVITVPIILDVIDNARKGAIKDSAYGYKDAINKYYVTKLSEDQSFRLDGTYTINSDGTLTDEEGTTHTIPFSGNAPIGGSLVYEDNILKSGNILFDGYTAEVVDGEIGTVSKGSGEQQVAYKCIRATVRHKEECTQTSSSLYCSKAGYTGKEIEYGNLGSGKYLVSGDALDCDVNGDGEYNSETERFYYVSDLYIGNNNETNEPEFDSKYAVLVYYNNTSVDSEGKIRQDNTSSSRIAYHGGDNWHGPVIAISNLPTVEQWSNVSLFSTDRAILNENGEGTTNNGSNTLPASFSYTKEVDGTQVPLAARFLTTQELEKACGITVGSFESGELDICNYLLENTKFSGSGETIGYWLETPRMVNSVTGWSLHVGARNVNYSNVSSPGDIGSRPVIEVLKTDIQK